LAAIIGDSVNYWVGNYFGERAFNNSKFFRKEYLEKTKRFYQFHGSKAIVIGRFVPIIRTFVPFVAGIGKMDYKKFLFYNVLGGIVWVSLFLFGGYFFGGIPFIEEHFSLVVLVIIIISFLPILYELLKKNRR
jgi:membrane-associated protein